MTFTDQLGSVRDVLDADTGSRLGAADYDPYGTTRDSFGTLPDYRYAGLLWDGSVGLYASATRFYDPGTTRWMTRDWIRESGGINSYSYVNGHPTMGVDPMGYKIDFLPGTTPGYKLAYYEDKAYVVSRSPRMQSGWDRLDLRKKLYKDGNWGLVARLSDDPYQQNGYAPGARVIAWNPGCDLDIGGGQRQSPAMGISHEIIHAVRYELGILIPMGSEFPWDMILYKPLFISLMKYPLSVRKVLWLGI